MPLKPVHFEPYAIEEELWDLLEDLQTTLDPLQVTCTQCMTFIEEGRVL